jgi:hypothetical protein
MIFIDSQKVARLHIPDKVGIENQTRTNLPLHSDTSIRYHSNRSHLSLLLSDGDRNCLSNCLCVDIQTNKFYASQ